MQRFQTATRLGRQCRAAWGGRSGWYPGNETGTRGGTCVGETSHFQDRTRTDALGEDTHPVTRVAKHGCSRFWPFREGRRVDGPTTTGLDGTRVPQLVIRTILTLEHSVTWGLL